MLYKKDFNKVAEIIREASDRIGNCVDKGLLIERFRAYLKTKNPDFDGERFLKECEVK